jgi:hypothetical protein
MRRCVSSRVAFSVRTRRLACVFRLTTNLFVLVLPQSCVKPRKSTVSGRRRPAAARLRAASRPNSISRVLPSWSDRPNCSSLSMRSARSCFPSVSNWQDHIVRMPADDHLPGCPTSAPLVDPKVDDVVEEHIGEDRADPRPLRRGRLHRSPLAGLEDAGLEPSLDQANPGGRRSCAPASASAIRGRRNRRRCGWSTSSTKFTRCVIKALSSTPKAECGLKLVEALPSPRAARLASACGSVQTRHALKNAAARWLAHPKVDWRQLACAPMRKKSRRPKAGIQPILTGRRSSRQVGPAGIEASAAGGSAAHPPGSLVERPTVG